MGIIGWILLGLLAGIIAKMLLPGDDPGGFIVTTLIGVAGALLGGFVARALDIGDPIDEFFDLSTWIAAILGAIALLVVWRASSAADAARSDRLFAWGQRLALGVVTARRRRAQPRRVAPSRRGCRLAS